MTEAVKRRSYDEEFKRKAVRMLLESNKPISTFALAIGVERSNLHRWLKRYGGELNRERTPPNGSVDPNDLVNLRREITMLKEKVDLLRSIVKRSLTDKCKIEIGR